MFVICNPLSASYLLLLLSVLHPCPSTGLEEKPPSTSLCLYSDDSISSTLHQSDLSDTSYFAPLLKNPHCGLENHLKSVLICLSNVSPLLYPPSINWVTFFNHAMIFTPHAFASA